MLPTFEEKEQFISRFTDWANEQPDIRVVLLVGSHARRDLPADPWSDLDLPMFVADPDRYLHSTDWLHNLGTPRITFIEGTAGVPGLERRVFFDRGLDVDFAVFPTSNLDAFNAKDRPYAVEYTFRRGIRVLVDKEGIRESFLGVPSDPIPFVRPTQGDFNQHAGDFLYHAVWAAKKLARGELWMAKRCCDGSLKGQLCRMLGWHARALYGDDYDTWHGGRFIDRWAESEAMSRFRAAFPHYEAAEIRSGILASMDLYRDLGHEVAQRFDLTYPLDADRYATELVNAYLPES